MAGKSNKSRNRKGSQSSLNFALETVKGTVELPKTEANGVHENGELGSDSKLEGTESSPLVETTEGETETAVVTENDPSKQGEDGDIHLYPVSVKTPSGEKLELRLSPGDSVMDLRQFLLDAPETCFFTCYDLILQTKDGSFHHLEDHNDISEVADITTGGCSLEMVDALYDDRSIRAHVQRARELISLSTLHASLSTSLALQQETAQKESSDAEKAEVPELDGLGFMEDIIGSLSNLMSSSPEKIKCVQSIVFSSFNPPPSHRRLVGDLIYIDVSTMEGHSLCITGTTKMFYVNSSKKNILDSKPAKQPSLEATTLIGLLQKINGKFKKAFHEILELKASAHPFENVQSLLPPNSWLGAYPIPDHKRDAARAENALTLSFGSELVGMQRDWNEELQSCREFPHTTPQERILRDRALYKVTCDFVDAAVSGAVGVISRCIPPINPTDPECFHMYVHNNIFFSFAVDADFEQLFKNHAPIVELRPVKEDISNIPKTDKIHDVAPDTAESQFTDSEQATYASANNDLKGTRAYQEADVPGLYSLAMAIIDYRGHRLVAQSIIPGILQGDKSDSLLYGSVDNGKKICWNETFHSKVLEAAKHLHLKEHTVLDGSGKGVKLAAPVECKGIVGTDDRHYLLDLMRATPRDANYMGPESRFCVLRPELVNAFCQAEAAERLNCRSKSDEEVPVDTASLAVAAEADLGICVVENTEIPNPQVGATESRLDEEVSVSTDSFVASHVEVGKCPEVAAPPSNSQEITEGNIEPIQDCNSATAEDVATSEEILLNPNVFTEFKLAGSEEEIAADKENVRKVGLHLKNVVLPKFIQDLCTLEVSPMDGQTLTEALHAHGINVRYIGEVANMTKHLPHVWDLCATEIVVRCAKHILKGVLRESQDHDIAIALAHFFNCFFGTKVAVNNLQSETPKKASHQALVASRKSGISSRKNQSPYVHNKQSLHLAITSESLWSDIEEFAKLKYQFDLPVDAKSWVKKVSVIRNLCQKVGITIAARKYDLNVTDPFQTDDILNLQPVVKHSVPVCSEARDLVETGKARLGEGLLNEAYTLFSEAFSILQQVTGPMHREVANCCRYLAMVLYHAGDMAGAIMQQHKELIINERCLGLDHPDTAHSYGNMALFYHGLNQTELALRHMSRTLLLLSLSSGSDHPDVAATFINVAMMYQDIGKMNTALRYLQDALKKNERLLGEDHIQTAVCYHALAIAFNCMGAFKLSLQHEKKTYDILVKQLGEGDLRTRDSQNWINTFKMRDLQVNAQKQKGQAVDAASTQRAIEILKANPELIQAFQAAAAAGGTGIGKGSTGMAGEAIPRGRGVDERAGRATAEVRKKALAKGLLVRPQGVAVQALQPPLTQLINIINEQADESAKESNGSIINSPEESKENGSFTGQEEQAPVGLGSGLTALESKKQKRKSGGTAS